MFFTNDEKIMTRKQLKKELKKPREIQKRYTVLNGTLILDRLTTFVIRNPVIVLDKQTKLPISLTDTALLPVDLLETEYDSITVYELDNSTQSIQKVTDTFNLIDKLMKLHEFEDVKKLFAFDKSS